MSPCAAPLPVSGACDASGIGVNTASGAPDAAPESAGWALLAVPDDAAADGLVAGATAPPQAAATRPAATSADHMGSLGLRRCMANPRVRRDMRRRREFY